MCLAEPQPEQAVNRLLIEGEIRGVEGDMMEGAGLGGWGSRTVTQRPVGGGVELQG